jgi:hypothetical protein
MKDEEATYWKKGFSQLPLDKKYKFKEVSWKAWVKRIFCMLCFPSEKEENECVKGKLVVVCENVLFM